MAGGDIRQRLKPGQTMPIGVAGDYIFLKAADREIQVVITDGQGTQKPVTMQAGDKYRPGPFKQFAVTNTDPERPAQIVLTVGIGDYNRQIVQGQITTQLKIRSGDGTYIDDTRQRLGIELLPVPGTGITETFGEVIDTIIPQKQLLNSSIDKIYTVDFNPEIHAMPVACSNEGNSFKLFEYDPVTNRLGRELGTLPSGQGDQARGGSVYGNTLYKLDSYGNAGLYRSIAGGAWEWLYPIESPEDIAVNTDGSVFVLAGPRLVKISQAGELLAEVSTNSYNRFIALMQGQLWLFASDQRPEIYDQDLNLIEKKTEIFGANYNNPMISYGAYWVELVQNGARVLNSINIRASETVVDLLAGRGYRACEWASLGARPTAFEAVRSTAEITVINAETGTPTVDGEIIKLAYEWLAGKPAPAEYLDYVHGVKIKSAMDSNGNKYPVKNVQSDGATFLAAGIKDQFTATFPAEIELIIDHRAGL
ncbi:hypothetical protein LL254_04050 [Marinobacter nauticus]|uniref:hypothetical protein n=1 Tax=Marinobacter nauticus TaxID=2743 RepID=UPI001D18EA20|nr:hypothetical protein [Marinobacter nauticus]MCC4269869.1 hypothetical protein [Marinobacter nauticus]